MEEARQANGRVRGGFFGSGQALAAFRVSSSQWSVRRARQQSDQVIGFHRRLSNDEPGLLSRTALLRGDVMARCMAYALRLAYLWVGLRMHTH